MTRPHYEVSKHRKLWIITRLDQTAHIGQVSTRREALQIARMLAGWRGVVTIARSH